MEEWRHALLFLEILLVNLLLSGDNAVVIAMAGRRLPPRQRKLAIWWGAAAAVGLRIALTVGAVALLDIPYLQTVGALLLLAIALQLLLQDRDGREQPRAASSIASAVWTIVAADFVMSLDNVLAVAAIAADDTALLVIGIAMSIPIIIWGSSFIMRLLDRLPWLVYAGGALLAYTAGEMAASDPGMRPVIDRLPGGLADGWPFLCVGLLSAAALIWRRRA